MVKLHTPFIVINADDYYGKDGFMDGEIVLHTLYRFEETAVLDSGRIQGFLKKAGTLCHTDKLMAAGLSV